MATVLSQSGSTTREESPFTLFVSSSGHETTQKAPGMEVDTQRNASAACIKRITVFRNVKRNRFISARQVRHFHGRKFDWNRRHCRNGIYQAVCHIFHQHSRSGAGATSFRFHDFAIRWMWWLSDCSQKSNGAIDECQISHQLFVFQ